MSTAKFFPLKQRRRRPLTLRSEFGDVRLVVDYGQSPQTGQWCCPVRLAWHLGPHQKITPGYAEKLCFTATATGSYEEAAQVASQWSQSIDDSTVHALVQRAGARAEQQAQVRYEQRPAERHPQRKPSRLGVLMVDGCQLRYRGPGWGKKKTKKDRVEWHELKLGVFYRHEQSAHTPSGRGILADKVVVAWQDQPMELGRRLNWEGLREGLGRARELLRQAELERVAGRPASRLSLGERKRAAMVCALAHAPELLLLDEPTSELDGRAKRRLVEDLRASMVARLIASHDLGFIESVSTRVIVLGEGGILADGETRLVFSDREALDRAHLI